MSRIEEIRNFLKENASEKAEKSWERSVPTSKKHYGVYISKVNELVNKYKEGGFELVKKLWKSGMLEERILSAKILGKIAKKQPDKALDIVKSFTNKITNWAVCDTLATQGIRKITDVREEEIYSITMGPWSSLV